MMRKSLFLFFRRHSLFFQKVLDYLKKSLFIVLIFFSLALLVLFVGAAFAGSIQSPVISKQNDPPDSDTQDDYNSSNYQYNSFNEFQEDINNYYTGSTPSYILTNNMLGISGPLSFSLTWSNQYDFILNTQYISLINDINAYAIEADLGLKENRINMTVGHAFSPQNRLKLTIERLAQKQSFNFDSGKIHAWVSQYAGGAEFQHLLGLGVLNNISVGGYYARAPDKTLAPVLYKLGKTFFINYRHIAGARSKGVHTSIGLHPWTTGIITLTGYYDQVSYHWIYENVSVDDTSEFGYGITLSQYISQSLQGSIDFVYRAIYHTVEASLQWMHNVFHDTRAFSLSLTASHTTTDTLIHDNRLTVGLEYYFVPMGNTYHVPTFEMLSLKGWVSSPAVHMSAVLAAADQMSRKAKISSVLTITRFVTKAGIIAADIDWDRTTTNIPHANFIYTLSVEKKSNPLTNTEDNFEYFRPFKDKIMTHDHHFTISKLEPGAWYRAKLSLTETVTGLQKTYHKAFQAFIDKVSWPNNDAHLTYTCRAKKTDAICQLDWDVVTVSLKGNPITYTINGIDSSKVKEQHCDNNRGRCTAVIESLTLGKGLLLSISAKDQYGQQATSISYPISVPTATITGLSWADYHSSSDPTAGKLSWEMAKSSDPDDQFIYTLTYDNAKPITIDSNSNHCDTKTDTCFYWLNNLTPNDHPYTAVITATATTSGAVSNPLPYPFSTAPVSFEPWSNQLTYKHNEEDLKRGTLQWTPAKTNIKAESPSNQSYQFHFDQAGPSMVGTADCSDTSCSQDIEGLTLGSTVTGEISVENEKYNISIKPTPFSSFTVDTVLLTNITDLHLVYSGSTIELAWTQPQIEIKSNGKQVNNDSVFYTIHGLSSSNINFDQLQCANNSCTVPLNSLDPNEEYQNVYLTYVDARYHQSGNPSNQITIPKVNLQWSNWSDDAITLTFTEQGPPLHSKISIDFHVQFNAQAKTTPSLGEITYAYQIQGDISENGGEISGTLLQGQSYSQQFSASTLKNPTLNVWVTACTDKGNLCSKIEKSVTVQTVT